MSNPVATLSTVRMYGEPDDSPAWRSLNIWCPGCDHIKCMPILGEDGTLPRSPGGVHWDWNGSLEAPTLSPSILQHATPNMPQCHSFLRDGRWEFLSDCTHALASQTVDMVPLPDWVLGRP